MRSAISSGPAYWSRIKLNPRAAARRIEAALPAATQSGGCGCCAGGGSTTISSKRQNRPRCEKRARSVQPRIGLFGRDLKAFEFAMAITFADAEIESAAGNQIEGCRLFREQHRVMP